MKDAVELAKKIPYIAPELREEWIRMIQTDALQEAAKWGCLNGYDHKIPEVKEIQEKILGSMDALDKSS